MESHTGPCNTIWDHMGPYRTRKDKTDPVGQYVAIPVHIGPWDVTGPYWILQDHMEPYGPNGTKCDCPVPYRTIKYHMGPSGQYGTIRDHTGQTPYGTIQTIWNHMGSYGTT